MNKTEDANQTIYLKNYKVPNFLIQKTHLTVELDVQDNDSNIQTLTRVTSLLEIVRNPESQELSKELTLHGQDFRVEKIFIDGISLNAEQYIQTKETLTLLKVPNNFLLSVISTSQPQNNTALEGLYKSSGNFCTQCEAEGFRRITYYLDQPDIMSVFTTKIIADKSLYPVLLANGNPIEKGDLDNGKHYIVWHDPFKKPSYLFALVAGQLTKISDTFTTMSGRSIELEIYVEEHNKDKCDHAMMSLKKAMKWDEEVFGLEYDLDIYMIVAVDDFNMGAMENKGLNVFNAKYVLAKPDTATDKDYEGIEAVIAHEYFHNWTGNRVTCRDWFQLSLKEGLTVFRDEEFTSDMQSRAVKRIDDVKILRTFQFAEDSSPMAHPIRPSQYIEINNFYTVTVYNKGAEVIRMIHTIIGKENFRKGMDLYFQRHDGQAVTTEDFVSAMSDASGIDLELFKNWYNQAGTPKVAVDYDYQPDKELLTVSFKQSCPPTPELSEKLPFHIPVKMGLLNQQGEEILADTLHLKDETSHFEFTEIKEKPFVSILRDFSAPVELKSNSSEQELVFLMGHDTDPFNRWEAGQQLYTKLILSQIKRLQKDQDYDSKSSLLIELTQSFKQLMADAKLDNSLKSLAMTLPDMGYLMEQMEIADIDNIYQARKKTQFYLAKALATELNDLYQACELPGEYQFNSVDAGKRQLKKTCLSYLMSLETESIFEECYQQFQQANNMTDSIGHLALLSLYQHPLTTKAFKEFESKWHKDPLVMDKWLVLQALSTKDNCLNDVKSLMKHATFDIKNPNRVRSLIGAFAAQNYLHFHAKDGSGYEFIAKQVMTLDKLNPQIAARLAKNFCRWKHFDSTRQDLMKANINVILENDLSSDVYEILSKSL
ncbi:MAG: aminopeptidase N [Gammaproteobacteria bacterium]|nr:aminopeptidase N [Gammaproteobacteria bacterium]